MKWKSNATNHVKWSKKRFLLAKALTNENERLYEYLRRPSVIAVNPLAKFRFCKPSVLCSEIAARNTPMKFLVYT
jgi:DNA topoisomerase VI subunit B